MYGWRECINLLRKVKDQLELEILTSKLFSNTSAIWISKQVERAAEMEAVRGF